MKIYSLRDKVFCANNEWKNLQKVFWIDIGNLIRFFYEIYFHKIKEL